MINPDQPRSSKLLFSKEELAPDETPQAQIMVHFVKNMEQTIDVQKAKENEAGTEESGIPTSEAN